MGVSSVHCDLTEAGELWIQASLCYVSYPQPRCGVSTSHRSSCFLARMLLLVSLSNLWRMWMTQRSTSATMYLGKCHL